MNVLLDILYEKFNLPLIGNYNKILTEEELNAEYEIYFKKFD